MDSVSSNPETEKGKQFADREVPVTVSGRGVGAETGESFTEQTLTKAIFDKGGVIRLSAEVNEGETIRIRNGENGREAAARVLKNQREEDGSKLVELEFAEAEPEFWVAQSTSAAGQSIKAREEPVKIQNVEPTSTSVEAAPQAQVPASEQATGQAEEVPVPDWMKVNKAWEGGESYPIRMQLPKAGESSPRTAEFAADSAAITAAQDEHLLPKPSLDFERFPGLAQEKTKLLSGKARRSLSGPIGALVAVVLLLIAAGIGSYRLGWLGGKDSRSDGATNVTGGGTSGVGGNAEDATQPPVPPKTEGTTTTLHGPLPESAGDAANVSSTRAPTKNGTRTNANRGVTAGKTGEGVKAEKSAVPVSGAVQQDGFEPPKLIKAVRSLSPPEALQAYASGVVTVDVVVDETGKVMSAIPIAGPKALYGKAAQTVREGYLYQPAMRNGKPVSAHVEAKIQFWYEP